MADLGTGPRLALALALLSCPWPAPAAEAPVDLELVLAVDVSRSMDFEEQRLQRAGYVAALTHPEVLRAIEAGPHGRVAIAYVEWAGPSAQAVVVPWRAVQDETSARAFAAALAAAPLLPARGTSISSALAFAADLFDGNGHDGPRRVIDVSGDGPNNMGPPIEPVREAAVARGIEINGLPIMLRPSPSGVALDAYYADCVIGGPGAFVLPVEEPEGLAEAIRRKLVLEIAGRPAMVTPVAAEPGRGGRVDCLVGERLRRSWGEP